MNKSVVNLCEDRTFTQPTDSLLQYIEGTMLAYSFTVSGWLLLSFDTTAVTSRVRVLSVDARQNASAPYTTVSKNLLLSLEYQSACFRLSAISYQNLAPNTNDALIQNSTCVPQTQLSDWQFLTLTYNRTLETAFLRVSAGASGGYSEVQIPALREIVPVLLNVYLGAYQGTSTSNPHTLIARR